MSKEGTKSHNPIYKVWYAMIHRTTNKNSSAYRNYGARGIKVCERWLKFENFLEDMGERPEGTSIDRIDNNGDYEPNNCRRATRIEQARNKRGAFPYTKNIITTSVNSSMPNEHKAVMKQDVADWFVEKFTQPDDIILDPFFGLGTTGIAARNLGRSYIGIEISKDYITIAENRLK